MLLDGNNSLQPIAWSARFLVFKTVNLSLLFYSVYIELIPNFYILRLKDALKAWIFKSTVLKNLHPMEIFELICSQPKDS